MKETKFYAHSAGLFAILLAAPHVLCRCGVPLLSLADIGSRRALLFLSFIFIIFFTSCSTRPLPPINMDEVQIQTRGGITYCNNIPCTGKLFRLYPHAADTAEIQEFENGKEHGVAKKFYLHHQLQEVRYFHQGKKEGFYRAWYTNGQPKLEYHFEKDEYEDNCREWSADGRLIRNMNYHQGHELGLQQMWTAEGKLWANYEVRDGRQYGFMGTKGCATASIQHLKPKVQN